MIEQFRNSNQGVGSNYHPLGPDWEFLGHTAVVNLQCQRSDDVALVRCSALRPEGLCRIDKMGGCIFHIAAVIGEQTDADAIAQYPQQCIFKRARRP